MQFYIWDTGIVVGYCFWPGTTYADIGIAVDPYSEKCDKFVQQKAISCQNRIPTCCESEAKHRIRKNSEILNYLLDMFAGRPPSSTGLIDYNRIQQIHGRIIDREITPQDAIKGLVKILGLIKNRRIHLYQSCHLLSYSKPPTMPEEKLLAQHLKKEGDVNAFITAIHFHQKQECIFITTDYGDFGNLDCEKLGITCAIPKIEFIKDIQ